MTTHSRKLALPMFLIYNVFFLYNVGEFAVDFISPIKMHESMEKTVNFFVTHAIGLAII